MATTEPQEGGIDKEVSEMGDSSFVGVDMRTGVDKLNPGFLSRSVNKRLNSGRADTREGLMELRAQEIGVVGYGACVFSDPEGNESIAVSTGSAVYVIRDGVPPESIAIPDGETMEKDVWMEQAFDKVFIFRGDEKSVLEWDGDEGIFGLVEQSVSGTGTLTIPGSTTGTAFINRLFVPYKEGNRRDSVLVSDDLDYTRYATQVAQFRINYGTADDIIRLFPFGRATMLVFKKDSIAYWTNLATGSISESVAGEITRDNGLLSPRGVTQIGTELWFLGRGGVFKVVPGADEKMLMGEETVSNPMKPFFDEVNWAAAGTSILEADEERLYVVVPWGSGVTRNNAIAVFNHITKMWEGYDTFAASVDCLALLPLNYLGRKRLWWIDRSGKVAILGEDIGYDSWGGTQYGISDQMVTRGYFGQHSGRKKYLRVEASMATWDPSYSITVGTEGPSETTVIVNASVPSRTEYAISQTAFSLNNANDNQANAYRGDYRQIGSDNLTPLTNGSKVNQHAERLVRSRLLKRGEYLTVDISNSQGSCRVRRVAVSGLACDGGNLNYS